MAMRRWHIVTATVPIVLLAVTVVAGSPVAATPHSGELWIARYDGPDQGWDKALAMVTSPDGSKVFVTGYSNGSGKDFTTIVYDTSAGDPLLLQRFARPDDDQANAIAVSPDGSKVFVTGFSHQRANGDDYLTVAYDAASGTPLWLKRFNGKGNDYDD